MSGHDDDLTPWHDDPLVRALRAPGTDDELAGEAEFLAAFRAAQPPPAPTPIGAGRLRRAGRRLGGGGTAVVVAVALGAGAPRRRTPRTCPTPSSVRCTACWARSACPGPAPRPRDVRRTPYRDARPVDTAIDPPPAPSDVPDVPE